MTKSGLLMGAMVAALALSGCNKTPDPPKAETESGAMNDVVTASANPQVGGAVMAPDKTILANARRKRWCWPACSNIMSCRAG